MDAVTLSTTTTTSSVVFALPTRASQVTYQYFFGSGNPSAVTVNVKTSLDNSNFNIVESKTTVGGDSGTFYTSAPFIKVDVTGVTSTTGSTITTMIIPKVMT